MANFHLSVPEELYEWLLQEKERRGVDNVQKVIRQILKEVRAEAERRG